MSKTIIIDDRNYKFRDVNLNNDIFIEYGNVSMIHFRHFVNVSKLVFYCNREIRNFMISNKKMKPGLCPNTSKSSNSRHVPKRVSLLLKA